MPVTPKRIQLFKANSHNKCNQNYVEMLQTDLTFLEIKFAMPSNSSQIICYTNHDLYWLNA